MIKKRAIAMLMIVVMLFVSLDCTMFTSTAATTITVASASDLATLNSKVGSATAPVTINFTADIDAADISFTSVNTTKKVIVNGNNHYIKNLKVNTNGLFTQIGTGSSITNLGLVDAYVTNFSASGEGYGILCGIAYNATITGCFVHGSMAIYGTGKSIGGMVGYYSGTMNNCFTVVDIHTDGSMVGGLIGRYTSKTNTNKVSISYSTGTIDNEGREYIGGLVGKSECSCLHQCYTTTFIKNPYADTVKSIGIVPNLNAEVYYDETISFQRQGDMDSTHRFNGSYNRFSSSALWAYSDTYYPQIAHFYNHANPVFKNISAISAAKVQLNDGIGYEYVPLSTKTNYTTATLTTNTGSNNNLITWKITGGIDEYIYDTSDTNGRNYGPIEDGLSGNTYDVNTGKYIFTTETDVVFTATSGNYERDIKVHVSNGTSPYTFSGGGAGTSASPFLIKTPADLDLVRMYCVDDLVGQYYYRIENDIDLSSDDTTKNWTPIIGFKGHLTTKLDSNKKGKNITNLNVAEPNITPEGESYAGLFGTISNTATIDKLYIPNANIIVNDTEYSGILSGTASNLTITNSVVSGMVKGAETSGQLIGLAINSNFTSVITCGLVSASDNAGGLIGFGQGKNTVITITDCLTASTVMDAIDCGGFIAYSDNTVINTSLSNSILYTAPDKLKHGLSGGYATVNNAFFYENHADIFDDVNGRNLTQMTSADMLTALNANGAWAQSNTKVTPYPSQTKKGNLNYMVTNLFKFDVATGNGTVENFTKASFNQGGYLTGYSYDGYSVNDSADSNYYFKLTSGGYLNNFTPYNGGKEIFLIKHISDSSLDVRYVIFDVKTVSINYKILLDDQAKADYLVDMYNTVLLEFADAADVEYGFILDTTVSDIGVEKALPIKLISVKDSISVELCLPETKYSYTVKAYSDQARTKPLSSSSANEFYLSDAADSVTGRYNLYFDITIKENTLPWGIYNIDK